MVVSHKVEVKIEDFAQGATWEEIFGLKGPIKVEICSGKDEFLIRQSELEPQTSFVGIERSLSVSQRLLSKIERSSQSNIRVVREDAVEVLTECFRPNQVQTFYINFPDPWPKRKHFKRRLIQDDFVQLMVNRLVPNGEIQFASDHFDYVQWALKHFQSNRSLLNIYGVNKYENSLSNYTPTLYMKKYLTEGRPIYFLKFKKIGVDREA